MLGEHDRRVYTGTFDNNEVFAKLLVIGDNIAAPSGREAGMSLRCVTNMHEAEDEMFRKILAPASRRGAARA